MEGGTLGEVRLFSGNFAPRGWAFCNGAIMDINTNTALFALIGCNYGGDCRATFALPDTRSRVVLGDGQGPGLEYGFSVGQFYGFEKITVPLSGLPAHTHSVQTSVTAEVKPFASGDTSSSDDPEQNYFAITDSGTKVYADTADATMASNSVSFYTSIAVNTTGNTEAHNNIMPVTALNYIICIEGLFPMRN